MADPLPPPPTAEQLGWLSVAPPTDEQDQPIAWVLADCMVDEVRWSAPIVHQQLTLERVQLLAVQWQGPVFRDCVMREVVFTRSSFAKARFESVSFERCSFERAIFENCDFDHCRFIDCQMAKQIANYTALRFCEITRLSLLVLDMRECDLSGTRITESSLQGPRLSKTRADTLTITGGDLGGAEWTACELRELTLDGVTVEGLRILDSEIDRAELHDGSLTSLAISGTKLRRLALARCPELPDVRLIDCQITELVLDECPSVASLLLADTVLGALAIRASVLYDAAFEGVDVERGEIVGGELIGVLFRAGRWAQLELHGVGLGDYVAVYEAHFEQLRVNQAIVDPNLDLRLDGDSYGDGSMTWGGVRGP